MIRLISQGNQHYVSEDGRVEVILDPTFETECDEPHPVKMRLDALRAQYSSDDYGQRAFDKFVENVTLFEGGRVFTKRTKEGYVEYISWHCPGGEVHHYSMWTSRVDGEWTDVVTYNFSETVGSLEKLLSEKITVVNRKRVALKTQSGAEVHATLPEDVSERTLEAIAAVGDAAARRLELLAELEAIKGALIRYDELMASDDAEFVDQGLHEFHLKRKSELEAMLA